MEKENKAPCETSTTRRFISALLVVSAYYVGYYLGKKTAK